MEIDILTSLLKVLFMIIFFVIVCVVGTLPIRSQAFKTNPKLRIIGSTFAGALFINVAILHILPESADTLEQYLKDGQDIQVFPLANLLMMAGFLVTIFFTKIMITHQHLHDQHSHEKPHNSHEQHHDDHNHGDTHTHNHQHANSIPITSDNPTQSLISQNQIIKQTKQIKKAQKKRSSLNQAYVLTIAIYFHTIFQGIAIGVQRQLSQFLSIAVAIAFHKWADALSMGCHYKAKHIPKKTAIYLIIGQAVLNVLSIGLGWIIALQGDVLQAIFLSLSAGTFLAISTMQLLSQQLHHKQYKGLKYGLLVLSTVFVSLIWFIENKLF